MYYGYGMPPPGFGQGMPPPPPGYGQGMPPPPPGYGQGMPGIRPTQTYNKFLESDSIERYLRIYYGINKLEDLKNKRLHSNNRVFAPIEDACDVFRIQFCNDECKNSTYDQKALQYGIQRVPVYPGTIELGDFINEMNWHPHIFTTKARFNYVLNLIDKDTDKDSLEKAFQSTFEEVRDLVPYGNKPNLWKNEPIPETTTSEPTHPKVTPPRSKPKLVIYDAPLPKSPEEIVRTKPTVSPSTLYKSINLEPFRKLHREGRSALVYKEYAQALGLKPSQISYGYFKRLMEGEDIDPIKGSQSSSKGSKPKLNISASTASYKIPSTPPVSHNISSEERIAKFRRIEKRSRAVGRIEGLEADGRIYASEVPMYEKALKDLDNDVNFVPRPKFLVRAGEDTKRTLSAAANRFYKWR